MTVQLGVYRPVVAEDLHHRFVTGHDEHLPLESPHGVILHSTESHDVKGLADVVGIADFLALRTPYEIHVIIDAEGLCAASLDPQTKRVDAIQFDHAPPTHHAYFGIEMIGFAEFRRVDWWDREPQLRKVARWLAYFHAAHGVPLIARSTADGIEAGGVTEHRFVSAAFHKSDHTDPGAGFPLGFVIDLAQTYYRWGWKSGGVLIEQRPAPKGT